MMTVRISETEQEFQMVTSYEEMKFQTYYDMATVYVEWKRLNGLGMEQQAAMTCPFQIIAILCGQKDNVVPFYNLLDDELEPINKVLEELATNHNSIPVPDSIPDHFVIDGYTYSFKTDFRKLNNGERISIAQLIDSSATEIESIPKYLSVVFRPSKQVTNPDTGFTSWKLTPFDPTAIEELDHRAEMLRKHFDVGILLKMHRFF